MTSTGPWRRSCRARNTPPSSVRSCRTWAIGYIGAHSPQAKGRIERLWETLQDRLVAELRLRRIQTVAAAEAYLPTYLADHRPAASPSPPPTQRPPGGGGTASWRTASAAATRAAWTTTIPCDSSPGWSRSRAAPTGAPTRGAGSSSANASTGACSVDCRAPASPRHRRPRRISSWFPGAGNAYAPLGARRTSGVTVSPLAQMARLRPVAALAALAAHLRRPARPHPWRQTFSAGQRQRQPRRRPLDETRTLTP